MRQQLRRFGRGQLPQQRQREEELVGAPFLDGGGEQPSDGGPHGRGDGVGVELLAELADERGGELRNERFALGPRHELAAQPLREGGAPRRRERAERARADDRRAGEEAAVDDLALLGAAVAAAQLHRLVAQVEHRLGRHLRAGAGLRDWLRAPRAPGCMRRGCCLRREVDEELDESGAEALPRAVARARQAADEPAQGVLEIRTALSRAAASGRCEGVLRFPQCRDEGGGGARALLRLDRREVPEEGQNRRCHRAGRPARACDDADVPRPARDVVAGRRRDAASPRGVGGPEAPQQQG